MTRKPVTKSRRTAKLKKQEPKGHFIEVPQCLNEAFDEVIDGKPAQPTAALKPSFFEMVEELKSIDPSVLLLAERLVAIGPEALKIAKELSECEKHTRTMYWLLESGTESLNIARELDDCGDALRTITRLNEEGTEALKVARELENK